MINEDDLPRGSDAWPSLRDHSLIAWAYLHKHPANARLPITRWRLESIIALLIESPERYAQRRIF